MVQGDADHAVLDTSFGRLRGRNPKGLKAGDKAILFIRPESLRMGKGGEDTSIQTTILSAAFEGNMTHVFLKGEGGKEITMTVGRHVADSIPGRGQAVTISYDAGLGIVLPEGKLARE